jgi:endonuclease-3
VARESKDDLRKRAAAIGRMLKSEYPDARTELNYSNPLELLVATMLSAQCTDARVNMVTKDLFRKYTTAADYAAAPQAQFEQEIKTTGFYRNKTKSIRAAAAIIREKFAGKVPENMEELLSLPGVARKTANVVLGNAFGKNEGIVADTHVIRLAGRLKLTKHKNNQGDRIEKDLMALVPRGDWTLFPHLLIFHGRRVCSARKPNCDGCVINKLCPSAFKV